MLEYQSKSKSKIAKFQKRILEALTEGNMDPGTLAICYLRCSDMDYLRSNLVELISNGEVDVVPYLDKNQRKEYVEHDKFSKELIAHRDEHKPLIDNPPETSEEKWEQIGEPWLNFLKGIEKRYKSKDAVYCLTITDKGRNSINELDSLILI